MTPLIDGEDHIPPHPLVDFVVGCIMQNETVSINEIINIISFSLFFFVFRPYFCLFFRFRIYFLFFPLTLLFLVSSSSSSSSSSSFSSSSSPPPPLSMRVSYITIDS
jgi:hypothetical protein